VDDLLRAYCIGSNSDSTLASGPFEEGNAKCVSRRWDALACDGQPEGTPFGHGTYPPAPFVSQYVLDIAYSFLCRLAHLCNHSHQQRDRCVYQPQLINTSLCGRHRDLRRLVSSLSHRPSAFLRPCASIPRVCYSHMIKEAVILSVNLRSPSFSVAVRRIISPRSMACASTCSVPEPLGCLPATPIPISLNGLDHGRSWASEHFHFKNLSHELARPIELDIAEALHKDGPVQPSLSPILASCRTTPVDTRLAASALHLRVHHCICDHWNGHIRQSLDNL
jgi:hypothetical protein